VDEADAEDDEDKDKEDEDDEEEGNEIMACCFFSLNSCLFCEAFALRNLEFSSFKRSISSSRSFSFDARFES